MARRAQPVRSCVGCRQRVPATELLRIVAVGNGTGQTPGRSGLVPDPARRLPGRGAHLHPDPACFVLAQRRRAFGRALRLPDVPDVEALRAHLGLPPDGSSAQLGTTGGGGRTARPESGR